MTGRSLSTATGTSVPMLPVGSSPLLAMGAKQDAHVLARVAEGAPEPRALHAVEREERGYVGQVRELDLVLRDPLAVGLLGGDGLLDLLVGDDAALGDVDEEHLARREPPLLDDVGGIRT